MDKLNEIYEKHLSMQEQFSKLKTTFHKETEMYFFDVRIDCRSIILPGHKFVLSSRSVVLAEQLSSGDLSKPLQFSHL